MFRLQTHGTAALVRGPKQHPHLATVEEGDEKGGERADAPPDEATAVREPEPSYNPDEIEGGEETEKTTPDV